MADLSTNRGTQKEVRTFLYSEGWIWVVGQSLGGPTGLLANVQDTDLPPRANWFYVDGMDGSRTWRNNDQTLKLEYTSLPLQAGQGGRERQCVDPSMEPNGHIQIARRTLE